MDSEKKPELTGRARSLANLTPYLCKPGQVLNPHGRPRKENTFSDTARELMAAKEIHVEWIINGRTKSLHVTSTQNIHYGIAAALIMESLDGNVVAAREILDRAFGKTEETIRHMLQEFTDDTTEENG